MPRSHPQSPRGQGIGFMRCSCKGLKCSEAWSRTTSAAGQRCRMHRGSRACLSIGRRMMALRDQARDNLLSGTGLELPLTSHGPCSHGGVPLTHICRQNWPFCFCPPHRSLTPLPYLLALKHNQPTNQSPSCIK